MLRSFRSRSLPVSLLVLLLSSSPASAQSTTYTWTGGDPVDSGWFEALNWSAVGPGSPPPVNNIIETVVVLTGNVKTTNTLDYSFEANSLTFDSAAGAFTVGTTSGEILKLGAGGLTVANGNANNQTFNANLELGADQSWANNGTGIFTVGGGINNGGFLLALGGAGNSTFGGVISGTGGLTKSGTGTLTLSGVNTYTGVVTVNGGTLSVSADRGFGAVPGAATAGKIVLDNGTVAVTAGFTLSGNRGIRIDAGGGTLSIASGQTLVYGSGGIIAGTGSLTVTGPGKLTLNTATTWSGPLVVNGGGTVSFSLNTILNTSSTATITLDNGTLENTNATVPGNGTFSPVSRNIVLGPGGGTLRYNTAGGLIIVQNTPSPGTVISGVGGLNKDGAGIIAVAVPATYSGPTHVIAGTLRVRAADNIFPITTALTVNSGATFDLSTQNQRVGSLTGAGIVNIGTTGRTFTVGDANSTTFTGVIQGIGGNVTKQGAGTLTVSGNTYSGTTTISAGTLKLAHSAGLGFGGPQVTAAGTVVNSGFTLDLNGIANINEAITLTGTGVGGNGALINSNTSSAARISNGIAAVTRSSGGSTSSSTTVSISGGGGTGAAATASLGLTTSSFTIDSGTQTYSVAPTVAVSGNGVATAVLTGGLVTGVNITTIGSGYTTAPTISFTGGTVLAAGTAPTGTGNATNFTVVNVTITNPGSGYTSTPTFTNGNAVFAPQLSSVILGGSASIGGAGSIVIDSPVSGAAANTLNKLGTGTLTLNGINTYTGATTVSAGTLAGTGSLNSAVGVASGATLSPGSNGAGTLTTAGNVVLNNGSKIAISAAGLGINTGIAVTGSSATFDFKTGSILDLSLTGGFGAAGSYTIVSMPTGAGANVLLDATATTNGQLLGSYIMGSGASGAVTINPSGFALTSGDTFTLTRTGDAVLLTFSPVPEPVTVLGIAAGTLGLGGFVRRRLRPATIG